MRTAPRFVTTITVGAALLWFAMSTAAAAPPESDPILEGAFQTAHAIPETQRQVSAMVRLANACAESGLRGLAERALEEAAALASQCTKPEPLMRQVGSAYVRNGLYEQAHKVADSIGQKRLALRLLTEIADAHLDSGDRQKALEALGEVVGLLEKTEDAAVRVEHLAAAARRYAKLGRREPAASLLREAAGAAAGAQDSRVADG
ncbi:unnamed protein product, partial [marine sediment metagenome]